VDLVGPGTRAGQQTHQGRGPFRAGIAIEQPRFFASQPAKKAPFFSATPCSADTDDVGMRVRRFAAASQRFHGKLRPILKREGIIAILVLGLFF